MKRRDTRLRHLPVLLVVLGLAVAACSNSSGGNSGGDAPPGSGAPGVTDTEIQFSVLGTRTNNPLGTCMLDCFSVGVQAYFDYRNSEGGVHGRDLVVAEEIDDELGQNQEKAIEIISANETFATFSVPQLATGWKDLAEAGVPLYGWAIHPAEMVGQESIFGNSAPPCLECPDRTFPYVAQLAGATRIGALGYGATDNSKRCASQISDTIDRYQDDTGQQVAYFNDSLPFGLSNGVGPEVTAMQRAGVELVITCLDLNGMKTLAQELERQGMGDVPLYHLNTYNKEFVQEAGQLFEGDYMGVAFRPFEANPGDTGMATFMEWMGKDGNELNEMAMVGWINADLAYQGILAAGPSFTRESVIAATNELTEYTADGLIFPVDWSRQHESPTMEDPVTHGYANDCRALVQVQGGEFEIVGGTEDEPFVCWPPEHDEWSEPTATTFS